MTQIMAMAAYGDAVGAPYEFSDGAEFRDDHSPILKEYLSFPKLHQAGEWTDDTYMAIAILEAWCRSGYDHDRFMENLAKEFVKWRLEDGNGIGMQTAAVLQGFTEDTVTAQALWDRAEQQFAQRPDNSAGNGAIMRCHALAALPLEGEDLRLGVIDSTRLTHGDPLCQEAALLWVTLLRHASKYRKLDFEVALSALEDDKRERWREIIQEAITTPSREFSTRGWWVVPTMQQALSAVYHNLDALKSTPDIVFREIIEAPETDSDTVCAVAGGLIGALGVWYEKMNPENVELIHGNWPERFDLNTLAGKELLYNSDMWIESPRAKQWRLDRKLAKSQAKGTGEDSMSN